MAGLSVLTPFMRQTIIDCVAKGYTNGEIAQIVNVNPHSITRWFKEHPELGVPARETRLIADRKVEESLYHRALGYSHPEEKVFCNAKGEVTRVITEKHYPPDTVAAMFWLRNRQPRHWRDTQHIEHEGNIDTGPQVVISLPSNGREILVTAVDDTVESLPTSPDTSTDSDTIKS